jgi:hypothetical protein
MKPAVIRLVLTAALFAGWLGYLGFQVATLPATAAGQPLILSRPQILSSEIDVIADVPDKSGKATIVEVLYPADALKAGDVIQVTNIGECAPPPTRGADGPLPPLDWQGPGRYLLPLRRHPDGKKYEVAPIPPSPGFFLLGAVDPPSRLYPDTPETRAQYHRIGKGES